jgi:hypothetical protein
MVEISNIGIMKTLNIKNNRKSALKIRDRI